MKIKDLHAGRNCTIISRMNRKMNERFSTKGDSEKLAYVTFVTRKQVRSKEVLFVSAMQKNYRRNMKYQAKII